MDVSSLSRKFFNKHCVKQLEKLDLNKGQTLNYTTAENSIILTSFLCNNGKFIISVRQCDGIKDCLNGDDETNCLCYIDKQTILDSYYCRKMCQYPNCTCYKLLHQNHEAGCHTYMENELTDARHTEYHAKDDYANTKLFKCSEDSSHFSIKQVNDLIPDCKSNEDESILESLLRNNSGISPKHLSKDYSYCFYGHPHTFQ